VNNFEETIFNAARQLTEPAQRALYLKWACAEDAAFRERIERLLTAEQQADAFLTQDPLELKGTSEEAVSSSSEDTGTIIDRYKLLQKIGEGGCGVVYMAQQEEPIRRRVALKVIKLGMDTKQVIARFEVERQALALMDHPNIARVLDAGTTDTGRPYFVMELVRGIRITDYCDQNNLPTRERLALFMKICHAIQHAHQKGIIHRDIKPSNILVTLHDGVAVPKVIDFGIAKATEQKLTDKTLFTAFEQFIGTPAYTSPEQAEMSGLDVDTRTDIYSLGVLLYELLVGKTPFDSKELMASGLDQMRRTIRERDPTRPSNRLSTMIGGELSITAQRRRSSAPELIHSLQGDLDWIVMKCLEKDRTRRYETANGLSLEIQRYLNNEPVLARGPSNVYRLKKMIRRNRLLFAAASVVVLALASGVVVSTWQWRRSNQSALEERRHRERAETAIRQTRAALAQMEAVHLGRAEELLLAGEAVRALPYWALILRQNPDSQLAARRLLSTLTQRRWATLVCAPLMHSNRVTSALFNRNGTRIVTAASDHTASVWDAATGARVCGPLRHDGSIEYVELSADDSMVITASKDRTMRLWNAVTGVPLTKPVRFENALSVARISPAGSHFLAVEARKRLNIGRFPPGTNEQFLQFEADTDEAEFSGDGRLVACNSRDGVVLTIDVDKGVIIARLPHPDRVRASVFHPDGQWLATSCNDGLVRLWDIRATNEIRRFAHSSAATSLEFRRDGKFLATGDASGLAKVWDIATGKPVGRPLRHNASIRSVSFSPGGEEIITSSWDNSARMWDLRSGQPLCEPILQSYPLFWAQFHPSGQRILTAGRGNAVCVWSVPQSVVRSETRLEHVQAAEFAPDGTKILITSARGVGEFDSEELQPVHSFTTNEPPLGLAAHYIAGGSQVAFYRPADLIQLVETRSGKLVREIRTATNLSRFAISEDARWLLMQHSNSVELLSLPAADSSAPLSHPHLGPVRTALFSPDSHHLLTIAADGLARVWSLGENIRLNHTLHMPAPICQAAYSLDALQIATADEDQGLRLWDSRTARPIGPNILLSFKAYQCLFSPDGRRLAVRVGDPVWLFDPATGRLVKGPIAHAGLYGDSRLAFSPDSSTLVTSDHGALNFWNSENGARIGEPMELESHSVIVAFHPTMERLLCVTSNGTISVRNVLLKHFTAPAWLPALAEGIAAARFGADGRMQRLNATDLWRVQQEMLVANFGDLSSWSRSFLSGAGGTAHVNPVLQSSHP